MKQMILGFKLVGTGFTQRGTILCDFKTHQ